MSSILDALKKSDQQRSEYASASPYPHAGSGRQSTRRRRWRLPLVLLLLASTAAVWWWLSPDSLTRPEVSVVTGSRTQPAASTVDAGPELAPAPAMQQQRPDVINPVNDRVIAVNPMPASNPQAELPASEAPVVEEPVELPVLENGVPIVTEPANQVDPKLVEPESIALPATRTTSEGLTQLSQLSTGDREALNALKISIVVYDPEPSRAFAIVNGARLKIGDKVLPGVNLSRITRDGLVLDVDGQQVLMNKR